MIVYDSMTGPIARTVPRAVLVLGVLSLPFLPTLASGEPPADSARVAGAEAPTGEQSAKAAASPATNMPSVANAAD